LLLRLAVTDIIIIIIIITGLIFKNWELLIGLDHLKELL